MSTLSWQDHLRQTLTVLRSSDAPQAVRVAVVGMGHEMRGDDGAGVAVARLLPDSQALGTLVRVIDAGHAPENQIGPLVRFRPGLVLLIDAAQMQEPPGTVLWLDWRDTAGFSASTHTLPPHVLASYLTSELGCEVGLLGIQPGNMAVGAPLSPAVRQAVLQVTEDLPACLGAGREKAKSQ